MITFRALGALLQYPSVDLMTSAGEISVALKEEGLLKPGQMAAIDELVMRLTLGDLLQAQEEYVGLFDRSRTLSLHLFEHVHGESRDRGQAMVNLLAHYEATGYSVETNELPDFLPLFLEFLSLVDQDEAADLLSDVGHIIAALRIRLERRRSAYAAVFAALESLASKKPDAKAVESLLGTDKPPEKEQEELDAEWEEAPAFSGAPGNDCPAARDTLNRMADPSATVPVPRAAPIPRAAPTPRADGA